MPSGSHLPHALRAKTSDRRKEPRYKVEIHGELRCDGAAFAVRVASISGSGALVFMEAPPPAGSKAELWIKDFGILPIEIAHAGERFCGVAITNQAGYRDRLLDWFRQEVTMGGRAAAVVAEPDRRKARP
jgi:PilZ domain